MEIVLCRPILLGGNLHTAASAFGIRGGNTSKSEQKCAVALIALRLSIMAASTLRSRLLLEFSNLCNM